MSVTALQTEPVVTTVTGATDQDTAEARLRSFLDEGTVALLPALAGCGVLSAIGRVGGVRTVVFACDRSVQGGAMGRDGCETIVAAYEHALGLGCPVVGFWHSGGARLGEGVRSLHGVGRVFAAMTKASGRIPQISVVLGPAAGGAAYGPALTDVVVMAPEGRVFVTGPDVVRSATGEDVDSEALGGADANSRKSGVAHVAAADAEGALAAARALVGLLADQRTVSMPDVVDRDLGALLPASAKRAYDVHPLVDALLDEPGLELQPLWARNIVTSLGRLGGRTVGVVANNPLRLGGCLDAASAEKAARFVRFCDSFGVPLVVLVDVPGYLPGTAQEWGGVVRRGAKLLHAFAEAVVPRVTLLVRKAYGGAYIAMNSRSLGATKVLAWPTAEVGVMAGPAAVRVLHRRRLAQEPPETRAELEAALVAEYERRVGGLEVAVAEQVIDAVVAPEETRTRIAAALVAEEQRRGAHNNIPL